MKLNKNKIIVSALALAIGGSLAGSVGSTIAWYQYSTRANVSFLGQASGISGNLQMRFVGEANTAWRTRITYTEIENKLIAGGYLNEKKVTPMTFGAMDKDADIPMDGATTPAPLGYIQPAFGVANMSQWTKATKKHYAQFELELRYNERDGVLDTNDNDEANVQKDVYLSKLLIQEDYTNTSADKEDLSDAVRVHIHAYKSTDEANTKVNKLISKTGGTTATSGKLDLDGLDGNDKAYTGTDDGAEFGFGNGTSLEDVVYGSGVQTAYAANENVINNHKYLDANGDEQTETTYPALVTSNGNELKNLKYNDGTNDVDKRIGNTEAGEDAYLRVRVTIWVEGWQKLSDHATPTANYSSIWNAAQYANSKFNVGIQFAVQDAFAE